MSRLGTTFILLTLSPCLLLSALRVASGETIAFDSASDPAYATQAGGAWVGTNPTDEENPPGMDNGGTGFLPWNLGGGFHSAEFSPYGRLNHFISGVDFSNSAFNDLDSPAFALTNANQPFFGYTARATRPFAEPLAVGDVLTVEFDNPLPDPLQRFDEPGFLIRLNAGGGPVIQGSPGVVERFGVFVASGFNGDNWTVADSAGLTNSGVNASDTTSGAQFRFTLTDSNSYSFELLRLSNGELLYEHTGTLRPQSTNPIDALEITMYSNGSGDGSTEPTGAREFFFNNLRIERPGGSEFSPGDFNRNGVVDAADYVVWRNTGGSAEQYNLWREHFGAKGNSGSSSLAAVPEPASVVMLLVGATIVSWRRRRCGP